MIKVGLAGCSGRMGRALLSLLTTNKNARVVGGIVSDKSKYCDSDLSTIIGGNKLDITIRGLHTISELFDKADVVIEFTNREVAIQVYQAAKQAHKPLVSGTTGLLQTDEEILHNCALHAPILWSTNMSIGVNLLLQLVKQSATKLPATEYESEVLEMHHKHKLDCPSGTAKMLGKAIAVSRNIPFIMTFRNEHSKARKNNEIGFASLRGGSIAGEHKVIFAGEDETIILEHKANDRMLFARGAVKAAMWLYDKAYGLYSMQDVLQ